MERWLSGRRSLKTTGMRGVRLTEGVGMVAAGRNLVPERQEECPVPAGQQGGTIPHFEFSTEGLAKVDQFDAWRHNFAPMLDLTPTGDAPDVMAGRQVIWDLGCLAFTSIRTDALHFASLPGHVRRDALDHWMLTSFLDGEANTIAGQRSFSGGAGAVQLHSLGRPFDGRVTDSDMLMMLIPRDFFQDHAGTLSLAEFSTFSGGMGSLLADFIAGLARRLPTLGVDDLPGVAAATRAMILACINPSPDHLEQARAPMSNILLERARQIINANLCNPSLDNDMLCRALGISRTRLYRLFEPSGGVMRYILHRRLLDAHSRLADPTETRRIFEIAEQRGFNDGAEFSRAFRREFGYSPSEVRSRGLGAIPARPVADLASLDPVERLGHLLWRLQS